MSDKTKNKNKTKDTDKTISKTPSTNPIAGADPITQLNEFKDNINELNKHLNVLLNIVKPTMKSGFTIPCQVSQKLTNQLCSFTDFVSNGLDSVSGVDDLQNLMKMPGQDNPLETVKQLAETSLEKTKQMYDLINGREKKIGGNITNQKGGGLNNKYLFIINPETNRKVSIYGKTGQRVIKKYYNNMNI